MPVAPASRDDIERQVTERAARDTEFRQALTTDPHGTLDREFGFKIPDGVELTVLEESPRQIYLVLPQRIGSGDRLSDEDLEKAAGGDPTYYPSYGDVRTCFTRPC